MTRIGAGPLLCGALAALSCGLGAADAGAAERRGRPVARSASPGKVVAAEIAFARLAQSKGQWTAFRETAAEDAVMFVPQLVKARDWLKRQKDPARAVSWRPHQVWLSCDGSLAVSYGAWQGEPGSHGYFTTVWERQQDGGYKWVMDQGDATSAPLSEPEMIGSGIAACGGIAPIAATTPVPGLRSGTSKDRTLAWTVQVSPDCGRTVSVRLFRGNGNMETVLDKRVAPPTPREGAPASTCAPA